MITPNTVEELMRPSKDRPAAIARIERKAQEEGYTAILIPTSLPVGKARSIGLASIRRIVAILRLADVVHIERDAE